MVGAAAHDREKRDFSAWRLMIMRFGSPLFSALLTGCLLTAAAAATPSLHLDVSRSNGQWSLLRDGQPQPILRSGAAARVNGQWLNSKQYSRHTVTRGHFESPLGAGSEWTVTNTGLAHQPDLVSHLRLYEGQPWLQLEVDVVNSTGATVQVSDLRLIDAPTIDLGGPEPQDRVLSDSFSEDRPALAIYDLGRAPNGVHRATGSQLIYNRASHRSLLLAALTTDKWLTLMHLRTHTGNGASAIASLTADSTGTTEIMKGQSLSEDAPEDQITLQLSLAPHQTMRSEQMLVTAADGFLAPLEQYGHIIRVLHHPRTAPDPMLGWWSWTAYYFGINEQAGLTNAAWLSQHLLSLGFNYFHIDEGYQYARGEYGTPDAPQFPHGVGTFGHAVTRDGLRFGIWTAPFEVSERAWVYQHHPDWLVHNAAGRPIPLGWVNDHKDRLYCLDATNPGAQVYLRATYKKLTRRWNVTYIKLDFMDDTSIEGYYHRPHTTALEAQRIGLQIIRDAVGPNVLLDKDGSTMLNPVGILDCGRISQDTGHTFGASHDAAPGIAARFYMNGNFFTSDPDAFSASGQTIADQGWHNSRTPLSLDEAKVSVALTAVSGGMYEIGDDLPTLGSEPDRLALVTNPDLLAMVRLQQASIPLDLMDYSPEDEQPSIFLLKEDQRQAMLTVFDWTEQTRPHDFSLTSLGLPAGHWTATDILDGNTDIPVTDGHLSLSQPRHSVRMIKLVNEEVAVSAPQVTLDIPSTITTGKGVVLSAPDAAGATPAVRWHWNFGDGTRAWGAKVEHAWTEPGSYTVQLDVTGIDGKTATQQQTVTVGGQIDTRFDPSTNRRYEAH